MADGIWAVYFYDFLLGHLNERERHVYGVHLRQHTAQQHASHNDKKNDKKNTTT